MSTQKIANTQTRSSRGAAPMEKGFHYVKVQLDSKDYESPIDDYLDRPSPTNPSQTMYEKVGEGKEFAGHRGMALLRCSDADYQAHLKEIEDLSNAKTSTTPDETFDRQTVLT